MGNTAIGAEYIYYFDDYDRNIAWETNPGYMVDGSENTHAKTTIDGDVELCDDNTYESGGSGTIIRVEIRVKAFSSTSTFGNYVNLTPIFCGTTEGFTWQCFVDAADTWRDWFDITFDPSAPSPWTWSEIECLDVNVTAGVKLPGSYVNCSKIDIRVTTF